MTIGGGDRFLGSPRFDVVLRGYDRRQVDEHLARLQRVISQMRADLEIARGRLPLAPPVPPGRGLTGGRLQAGPPQRPAPHRPAPHRPEPPGPGVAGGFTDRMQSILRAAEEEAAEIRRQAQAAARGDDRLRAQVADLVGQRDLVLAELNRMRGQLAGSTGGGLGRPRLQPEGPHAGVTPDAVAPDAAAARRAGSSEAEGRSSAGSAQSALGEPASGPGAAGSRPVPDPGDGSGPALPPVDAPRAWPPLPGYVSSTTPDAGVSAPPVDAPRAWPPPPGYVPPSAPPTAGPPAPPSPPVPFPEESPGPPEERSRPTPGPRTDGEPLPAGSPPDGQVRLDGPGEAQPGVRHGLNPGGEYPDPAGDGESEAGALFRSSPDPSAAPDDTARFATHALRAERSMTEPVESVEGDPDADEHAGSTEDVSGPSAIAGNGAPEGSVDNGASRPTSTWRPG